MLFEYQNITDNTRIDVVADVFCKQTDVNAPRPLSQPPRHRVKREVAQSCSTLWTPWTVAYQAPPSMGFSRQECWSGLPFPSPGSSRPRNRAQISRIAGRRFTV